VQKGNTNAKKLKYLSEQDIILRKIVSLQTFNQPESASSTEKKTIKAFDQQLNI